jgi:hypothetical protein
MWGLIEFVRRQRGGERFENRKVGHSHTQETGSRGASQKRHFRERRTRKLQSHRNPERRQSQGGGVELLPNAQRSERRNTERSLWIC